jgi:hypothetical protein
MAKDGGRLRLYSSPEGGLGRKVLAEPRIAVKVSTAAPRLGRFSHAAVHVPLPQNRIPRSGLCCRRYLGRRNVFRGGRRGARTSSRSAYFVTSPRVGREYIDLQLNAVRVTPPVSHMAAALIPTFGRLYGTLDAFCATDHDGLLKVPGRMTVQAAYAHSISGHRRKSL